MKHFAALLLPLLLICALTAGGNQEREAPRIVSTFVESCDFSGKTIEPFCTFGGSGIGSCSMPSHIHFPGRLAMGCGPQAM